MDHKEIVDTNLVSNRKISKLQSDRSQPEAAQVRAHNSRVKLRYPDSWKVSSLTNASLLDWVLEQKNNPCPYQGIAQDCQGQVKEIDHKIPLSRGGEHEIRNLQMLCEPCNRSKHDQTDEEFRESLTKQVPKEKPKTSLKEYGFSKDDLKDSIGRFRTLSLFKETCRKTSGEYKALYTLKKEEDFEGYISVYRVYMELQDPTEYRIATGLFGGLSHWKILCKQVWFKPHVQKWRRELKAKMRALATEKVLNLADSSSNGALQAIRMVLTEETIFKPYLLDDESKQPVGRPKKEIKEDIIPDNLLMDDLSRIKPN